MSQFYPYKKYGLNQPKPVTEQTPVPQLDPQETIQQLAALLADKDEVFAAQREPAGKSSTTSTRTKITTKGTGEAPQIEKPANPLGDAASAALVKATPFQPYAPPKPELIDYNKAYQDVAKDTEAKLAELNAIGQEKPKTSSDYIQEALLAFGPLVVGAALRGNQGGAAGGKIGSDSLNALMKSREDKKTKLQTLAAYKQRGIAELGDIKIKGLGQQQLADKENYGKKLEIWQEQNKYGSEAKSEDLKKQEAIWKQASTDAKTEQERREAIAKLKQVQEAQRVDETYKKQMASNDKDKTKQSKLDANKLTAGELEAYVQDYSGLDTLKDIQESLQNNRKYFNPITGSFSNLKVWDENAQALRTKLILFKTNFAQLAQKGVVTDKDMDRIDQALVTYTRDPDVAIRITKDLIKDINRRLDTRYTVHKAVNKNLGTLESLPRAQSTLPSWHGKKPHEMTIFEQDEKLKYFENKMKGGKK